MCRPRTTRLFPLFLLSALAFGLAASAAPAAPDLFDEIFARGRPLQEKLQTVRARFTETTVSSLLTKPTVSRGTLIAAKPPRVRLDYTSPERKTLVLNGNRLSIWWPDRREGEALDITETMKKVNQYFAGADPKQLRRMFTVSAVEDEEVPGSYRIDMVPRRKQIGQGLEQLQLWLDRRTLMLVQMKMSFPGGDSDTMRLEDAEIDVPLGPKAFDVEAPVK
jgi:outer membrane lipoprotein carrier protein